MKLEKFLNKFLEKEENTLKHHIQTRMKEISGIEESKINSRYAIQIIVDIHKDEKELLVEHEQYKKFKKSNALYTYHPEDKKIPVKGHYHIVDTRSKQEIYAVNTDGTAHHRKNKGFEVPKKHAKELKSLGVKFKDDNILENFSENMLSNTYSFFIIIQD